MLSKGDHSDYNEYKAFLLCGRSCVVRLLHLQSDTDTDGLGQSRLLNTKSDPKMSVIQLMKQAGRPVYQVKI